MSFKRIEVYLSLLGSLTLFGVLILCLHPTTGGPRISIISVADGTEPPPPPLPHPPSLAAELTPVLVADGTEPPPPPLPKPPLTALVG
jgi:hypothetical protein